MAFRFYHATIILWILDTGENWFLAPVRGERHVLVGKCVSGDSYMAYSNNNDNNDDGNCYC